MNMKKWSFIGIGLALVWNASCQNENPWFKVAYAEQLTHQSLVFRIGFAF